MKRLVFFMLVLACMLVASQTEAATLKAPSTIGSGLVGWWTFDGADIPNGRMNDKSSLGNNANFGNIASSTFFSKGKLGQAGMFDGTNDYAQAANSTSLRISTTWSIGTWFKPANLSQTSKYLFHKINNAATDSNYGILWEYTNNQVEFYCGTGCTLGYPATNSRMAVSDTGWHHAMYTCDGATFRGYLDGVASITPVSGVCTVNTDAGAGSVLVMGMFATSILSTAFNGGLDDVRVYNRALSAQEVKNLYNSGSGSVLGKVASTSLSNGLVGYWTFDGKDMPNGVARDVSGRGNNGNLINIATSTYYAAGVLGQAGNFDGVNDRISLGAPTSLQLSSFSISAWVKPSNVSTNQIIYSYYRTVDTSPFNGYFVGLNGTGTTGSGQVRLLVNDGSASSVPIVNSNAVTLSVGRWYHVVATRNASTGVGAIYINGLLANSSSVFTENPDLTSAAAVIGNTPDSGSPFNGSIDDVRVYNRALSATEISQLYQLGTADKLEVATSSSAFKNGLVGHWTFDGKDMPNGVVRDVSGNTSNGNLINIATTTFYDRGVLGQAVNLDGVNDYIDVGSIVPLGYASAPYDRTVCFWANGVGTVLHAIRTTTNIGDARIVVNAARTLSYTYQSRTTTPFTYTVTSTAAGVSNSMNYYCVRYSMAVVGASIPTNMDIDLFVNGVKETKTMTYVNFPIPTQFSSIRIGNGHNHTFGDDYFAGKIDDVRIYTRLLSDAEISRLYGLSR